MNASLFILLYSDYPCVTALFAFCSYANPASIFFSCFYVCTALSALAGVGCLSF